MTSARSHYAASLAIHLGFAALLFTTAAVRVSRSPPEHNTEPLFLRFPAPAARLGGGGGGARSARPASLGQLTKTVRRQFAPPMILEEKPALPVEPSLLIDPATTAPRVDIAQWGDPSSTFSGASNGPGSGSGAGDGDGPGAGPGKGPGSGPGDGPGGSGLRSSTGSGVIAPRLLYKVEPEFSEQARRAKHHGVVRLQVDIDPTGRPVNLRVMDPLGLGLDEKAVEAVSRWRFRPGLRDGRPVTMRATVEVNFHLL